MSKHPPKGQQLSLFQSAPLPDKLRSCSRCGRTIVVYRVWPDGTGHDSEFVSKDGHCYDCTFTKKRRTIK
jgi:hypothetical protein